MNPPAAAEGGCFSDVPACDEFRQFHKALGCSQVGFEAQVSMMSSYRTCAFSAPQPRDLPKLTEPTRTVPDVEAAECRPSLARNQGLTTSSALVYNVLRTDTVQAGLPASPSARHGSVRSLSSAAAAGGCYYARLKMMSAPILGCIVPEPSPIPRYVC